MKKKIEKILMIGPVYPYKSGIAHYTGLLCNTLRKKYKVEMISFKKQYPKLIFRQEQKDYSSTLFKAEPAYYWINTMNPVNIFYYALKLKRMKPEVMILQWWHPYFAPCYLLLLLILKKTPVFFICHNVFPHARFCMDEKLTRMVLKRGNGYIVQSKMDEADLQSILGECNSITAVHPTYGNFCYKNMSKEQARNCLKIEEKEKVLLFFGFIKKYKGLKNLLYAMPVLKEKYPEIRLLIVGEFDSDKEEYTNIIKELKIENELIVTDWFVPDEEVEPYFAASDLVMLPYVSATQSGIVQMAYGFEKPVVVTDVGGLPDVVKDHQTGYVVPTNNPQAIAEAVVDFYSMGKEDEFVYNIRQEAERFSWDRMVEHIETLWERL